MNIPVEALRRITASLLDRLETQGHATVHVAQDLYWDIDRSQRHDLDAEPQNLRVGQLTEDWWNLEEMVRDDSLCVAFGLTWLAAILREIGETVAD
jgi:hypothetical protein